MSSAAAGDVETRFSACTPGELPDLIAGLDAEFIAGRGRRISLALRFPGLFAKANLNDIFVGRDDGRIVCSLAVRRFRWFDGSREYAGAMIGAVWVDPALRGSGLGSRLLAHASHALDGQTDFAVLWTAQPAFYTRAGWIAGDCASFGEITGNGATAGGVDARGLDFARVRAIWQRQPQYAAREALWQAPLPPPAESLQLFEGDGAYAIAGNHGGNRYCYEMLGAPGEFGALLARMREGCASLYFNERTGSPAHASLASLGVRWQEKPLAMWLPLKREIVADAAAWYVPWLDRI